MTKQPLSSIYMSRNEQLRGWLYLTVQAALLPQLVSAGLAIVWPESGATEANLVMFALNALAAIALFPRFWIANLKALPDEIVPALWKAAIALIACRLGIRALNWLLYLPAEAYYTMTALGPVLLNPNDQQVTQMAREQLVLMSITTVFFVPLAEEALHRGAVFGSLYRRAPLAAYAVSILLFALIHVTGYIGSYDAVHLLLCAAQYVLPGLALCLLYAKTGTILAPILMHMLFNAMGILLVR